MANEPEFVDQCIAEIMRNLNKINYGSGCQGQRSGQPINDQIQLNVSVPIVSPGNRTIYLPDGSHYVVTVDKNGNVSIN